jgi:hypothetical protein
MLIKQQPVTLLTIVHKEGVAKVSAKPYSFYVAKFVDAEGMVLDASVDAKLLTDEKSRNELLAMVNVKVLADIRIQPSQYTVRLTLVDLVEDAS